MERIKKILNKDLSVSYNNNDTFIKLNLENTNKLLPLNDIYEIVNLPERFNIERQRCTYYRIIGTINATMTNALFNLSSPSGEYTWSWFNNMVFLDTSLPKDNDTIDDIDLTYRASIKNNLLEKNGWFGAIDPDVTKAGFCYFLDMEPKRDRFYFTPDNNPYNSTGQISVKNWELTITYPASSDKTHRMVNGGLLITSFQTAVISTKSMTAIGLSCKHNLTIGDIVRITGTNGYDGDHVVVRTGLDNGDDKEYFFVIEKPPTGVISSGSRVKKVINGVESEYYFRLFKKIKTKTALTIENDDYETYNLAFSKNVYDDPLVQFVVNEDIDIKDLRDNLGRPLTNIFLSIIKTSSNGLFTSVSSGIEVPYNVDLKNSNTPSKAYLRRIPVINMIHNSNSVLPFPTHTPLETNIDINNPLFYGDLVEYNSNILSETILAEVMHRFNTQNRETKSTISYVTETGLNTNLTKKTIDLGPRYEGYYYKAHHMLTIRTFSDFIETGDEFTEGIPDYATVLDDGTYIWRDYLDIGITDSNKPILDYPFLNNSHYLYNNFCFNLKRQDPFGVWGLYYNVFPEDPIGDRITDKFNINSAEDVC